METPLLMTDEQKRIYLKEKTKNFLDGLKKLETAIEASLQFTPIGIYPRIQVVPLNDKAPTPKN